MSRREKLVQRILQRPPEAAFGDVRKLLELFGWKHASMRGSHARFRKPGEKSIIVPVHNGKVGRVYLDELRERLNLEDDNETD